MALPTPAAATPYGLSLRPASFGAAQFAVEESSGEVGRRGQLHEYPFRDEPYAEDLGRRARRISFRAFVLGDDAAAQRDTLIAALEQKGAQLLVHPNLGEVMMQPDPQRPARYTERWDKLRMIEFDLAFVEPGKDVYPTSSADNKAATAAAATKVTSAGDQDLSDKTAAIGGGGLVVGGGVASAESTDSQATQINSSDSFDATVRDPDPLRQPLIASGPSPVDQEQSVDAISRMSVTF